MVLESIAMFIAEKVAPSIARSAAGVLCDPIGKSIRNMYHFKSNVEKLKNKAKELERKRKGVEDDVENAERQGESIKEEVTKWLDDVKYVAGRLTVITNEGNLAWHTGFFRYSKSMEAATLVEEVAELLKKVFPNVGNYNPTQGMSSLCVNDGDGNDNDFASRKSIFVDIMETLKKTDVKAIGLHGMGGVGKTTLVRKVCRQTKVDRLFDEVVMAEVSQNPDLLKVQGAIADDLHLKLQEESVKGRASRLRQRLKDKKVLVILDDVWQELHLEDLGIPFGGTDDGHCRILVISRYENVCSIMKSKKNILVKPLCYDEAWILFWKTVDDEAKQSQFEPIAESIVKKCAGLPVAILSIAGTLKGSDHFVWNKVSNELANFDCSDTVRDFNPVLKVSYDYLKNENAKSLFLLFGLHEVGHPILIDHLVRCVIGLGFLRSVTKLKAARDEVDQLIKELKNANLLLDSDRKDEVKMHDVIHVVAQKIASTEHNMFYIQDVVYLDEELEKDIYKDPTALSLHPREVRKLPEKLNLPNLKLLLLHSQINYMEIPDTFLDGMKELRVLLFNKVCLQSFVPSPNYESNIRTLSLEYCNLENITKVGMLKKLEVLAFSGPNLKRLPEEIGDLNRLKLLNLEDCFELEVIPPNVISKLTRLEELYVSHVFVYWDTPDNASLIELKQLHDLNMLKIHILDDQIIPQDFFPEKLERFNIVIDGKHYVHCLLERFDEKRQMVLRNTDYLQCGVQKLLQKTEGLFLDEIDGIRNVHPNLGGKGFPHLKHLRISRIPHILHLIKHEENDCCRPFHVLETLVLSTLNNLEKLCHGDSREEPFKMLKVIDVSECAALTQLISSSMTHLEVINVRNCENLTEVVGNDVPDDNITISKIVFTKLRTLYLQQLPKLTNFGPTAISRTLENIQEGDHEDLKSLFDNKVSFPSLKNLILYELNIPNIWCNQLSSSYSFGETLTSLVVTYCHHLKFLFSSSMVNGLPQLEKLEIYECESMEMIINKEGSSGENNFNSISSFDEKKLCHGNSREEPFRKLKVLVVEGCAALTQLISSSMTHLEEIKVAGCENLTEIVSNDVPDDDITISETVFTELHTLTLGWLPKLINFGPTATSTTLENIQEGDHEDLKSLFDNKVSFPSLKNLTLSSLNIPNIWCNQLPSSYSFVSFPSLKNLTLYLLEIPNIWCNQLPSSYSFGETLTSLVVRHCPHLKFLFSSSMVNGLQQLEKLEVAECESMEVIIKVCDSLEEILDVPEGSSSKALIMFSKLTKLRLFSLPNLKSFYNGLHISKWPSLKKLEVEHCDKVEMMGSEFQSLRKEKQSVPQPLFIVDKDAFPRLEELILLNNDNLKEIWHGGGIISKTLSFWGKTNIIKFPHYLVATDTLKVSSGYFKQIGGGSDNTFTAALRELRTLTVDGDDGYDDDDDDDDSLDESFESSDSLTCLVSTWVSFQNLTNLEITRINSGFRYLLTYSTAISLQHLTQLTILCCKKIEVIVMPPTDEVNDKIVFSQLKYLELQNLESLTSFYSGSHTLEFPSLDKMIVDRCPNMKVFSKGYSITQKLQRIQLSIDHDDGHWEGDLNSTTQKMFKEMVGLKNDYKLRLSKVPWLKEAWHDQVSYDSFDSLWFLTVDKCADMSSAIPLNLLPHLKILYTLTVKDCDSLEEVIHMEGLDVDDQSVLLPKLTRIQLIKLPRLRNVWSKHHLGILGFTNLMHLSVSKCNNLQYIFTTNIILGLEQLEKVEIRDCAMVETIITEDREKDAAISDIVVPRLEFIILESAPKLTCFHSGSSVLECSSLKTMTINDCPQIKTFVFTSTEDRDLQDTPLFNEKAAFPILEKLKLSKLPMVEHLWSEPCTTFQCLATIKISECVNLKSLVPYSASLQSLTTLEVSQCDGLTSLVTLSATKCLEQLARINVANCKIIREIITHIHTGDEENDRVVFGQLKYIGLHCLPNITGFYLGDYTMEFPALEQVVVRECQKMNTFSKGVVSTPKLKRVQRTKEEEEGLWENDLNTTVQLLFEETNVQSQKED